MKVSDMTDRQLNIALEVILGAEEDKHKPGNVIKGTYSVNPKNYCGDPAASLDIQEKAIEKDVVPYVVFLNKNVTGTEEEFYSDSEVADMLTASPRQRAEAAYETLVKWAKP